ncbi:MAG: hypothetical protein PVJ09_00385 [Candidatus Woesebacteria bacterium]|jgi:hypothetical protein
MNENLPQAPKSNAQTQSIYDVSLSTIFGRNFLAGMSRALGGIFIYLLFLICLFLILKSIFWPKLEPYLDSYQKAMQSIEQLERQSEVLNSLQKKSNEVVDQEQVNNLLKKLGEL